MKRKLLRCVVLTLVAGCLSAAGWTQPAAADAEPGAAEEARRWLERMIQATQTLNYEGTFIYVQGPHIEAMRIIHGRGPDGERQLLISLNGPHREIVVTGGVARLAPDPGQNFTDANFQRSPFPLSIPRDLSRLEGHYQFKLLGEDRIAGLATRVIAIKPRDAWRYGYRIWLDQRHGIVLRSALLDGKGYPIEQLMFTDVRIKPRVEEAADLDPIRRPQEAPETRNQALQPPAGEPVTRSAWRIVRLPEGFTKVLHNRFTKTPGHHPTEHIVFADGLATISVFLEPLDGAPPLLQGGSQLGSMNAFGTVVEDHQVLVVGEVPAATVRHIATSIHHGPEAESP